MDLENIILSEISQKQKDKYGMIPLLEVPRICRLIGKESKIDIG